MSRAFGEPLRQARERRGLSLEDVAEATRISRRHLEALERSDLDALPPGPFGKGYVRTYARLLAIDPEPILETYRQTERERGASGDDRLLDEMSHLLEHRGAPGGGTRAGTPARRWKAVAIALGGVVALGALVWFLAGGRTKTRPSAERSPTTAASRATARPSPTPASAPSRPTARPSPKPTVKPSPTAEAAAASAASAEASTALEVPEHGVGSGLVDRRLVGRSDRFAEGTTVTFWTLVVGGRPGQSIRHVWLHEGRAAMRAELRVGGRSWRTYSRLQLPMGSTGSWQVEARTADGRLLARDEFVCEPKAR